MISTEIMQTEYYYLIYAQAVLAWSQYFLGGTVGAANMMCPMCAQTERRAHDVRMPFIHHVPANCSLFYL